jgi:transcriptional regulator of acetoin/glycerol metabolism
MKRAPHPDDARTQLRAYARRRKAAEKRVEQVRGELPDLITTSRASGLPMTEIARLAGIARDTLYDHTPRHGS